MDIQYNVVNQLSSCFINTQNSSTICYTKLVQKIEKEKTVKVIFNNEENELENIVTEIIDKLVVPVDSVTEIQIHFHVLKAGFDLFSCLINSFAICAIIGKIPLKHFICSSSSQFENGIGHMAYCQNKPFNIKLDGFFNDISIVYDKLEDECKKNEQFLKMAIDQYR